MARKTIVFVLLCPVLFCIGCGNPEGSSAVAVARHAAASGFEYARPCSAFVLALPDSTAVPAVWRGGGPLLLARVSSAVFVMPGDTIASGTEPFLSMELERLNMRLELAEATGNLPLADSLRQILADSAAFFSHILSPGGGRLMPHARAGETLVPMQSVATVVEPPSDSLYLMLPLFDLTAWPDSIPDCTVTDIGLLCTGTPPAGGSVQGFYLMQGRFIHERGLSTYVVSSGGDSLPISVSGSSGQFRVIYSSLSLDSIQLVPWD